MKYWNNPCIFATGEICNRTHDSLFSSYKNDRNGTLLEICNLNPLQANQDTDTPTKVTEINSDIFTDFMHSSLSYTFKSLAFSSFLKLHNITAVFKNGDTNWKNNYTSVSILTIISIIFEQCMFRQLYIYNFMGALLSKCPCKFRKLESLK